MISTIRLSIGTAIALQLRTGKLPVPPTTAYLMVGDECLNNCAFCTQAREASSSGELLSRVIWPEFDKETVMAALEVGGNYGLKRICLQCLIDPSMLKDLPDLVKELVDRIGSSVSVSISAVDGMMLDRLKEAGAARIGIALDGASEQVFENIKGGGVGNPYTWGGNWRSLRSAVDVFGSGNVSTHIIVGLGETDEEIVSTMIKSKEEGILVSLFAYTPMKGTKDIGAAPDLKRYRGLQLARSLIMDHGVVDGFSYDTTGKLTGVPGEIDRLDLSLIFQTRGCPDCNRPYYNERPRGPMYNYPRPLAADESEIAISEAIEYLHN